jgi:alpha-tubulin suppressor-like RCC1 family protein
MRPAFARITRRFVIFGLGFALTACIEMDLSGLDPDAGSGCYYCYETTWPVVPFEAAPTPVAGELTFRSLSVGTNHVCGITRLEGVQCWGARDVGTPAYRAVRTPAPIPDTHDLGQVSAGDSFACGVAPDARSLCWGANASGALGNGDPASTWSPSPTPVTGALACTIVSAASAIGSGAWYSAHTCGLAAGGAAYCWGGNGSGQLGNDATIPSFAPVPVAGGRAFEAISVGPQFTCGIARGGAPYCWGAGGDGQLGDPATVGNCAAPGSGAVLPCSTTPVRIPGGHAFTAITVGGGFACGLDATGAAYCWGANLNGQLGNGTNVWSFAPAPVSGSLRFTAISAGTSAACALTTSREAFCWGSNVVGQLGDATTTPSRIPVKVATTLQFASIAVGHDEACALTGEGVAYCWGSNEHGKLGNGRLN